MLFSHRSPLQSDEQMPDAFMNVTMVSSSSFAGFVSDHGSGDDDPVLAAGRLVRLRFSCNRLLSLHHSGGALCTQGALTVDSLSSPCQTVMQSFKKEGQTKLQLKTSRHPCVLCSVELTRIPPVSH